MNDPQTWTTVWGWTMGVEAVGGLDRGGQRGKNWVNCNRINKNKKREEKGIPPAGSEYCRGRRQRARNPTGSQGGADAGGQARWAAGARCLEPQTVADGLGEEAFKWPDDSGRIPHLT